METVAFTFTRTVYCPPAQAGRKGETKNLTRPNAEHLQRLGYGTIIEESINHDGTNASEDTDGRGSAEPAEPAAEGTL